MAIDIRQEEHGDVRVLALSGRLDTETSADLELALQDLQAAGATQFLIDMTDIGYVSSAGLRVLLALAKQLEGGRGTLKLCALNDSVRQVFDVAGFSRLFAIYADRDAALGAAAPAAKAGSRSDLARRAAGLLGAGEPGPAAAGADAERLARAAAQLLGADGAPARPAAAPQAKSKAAPAPAQPPAGKANAAGAPSGVLGKFKNLFGKK